ncbi:serine/threonine protein kinase [Paenibacillus campi]|uniref:serine/threonine protein kinase n=1 Tax=Paenibacillus campi TaxID=3106031 RepID=UPI002AFFDC97|nr:MULTISPECIES: serine/threonine protein kinase [unclassified Paenibacillus]
MNQMISINDVKQFVAQITTQLIPQLQLDSTDPLEPIQVLAYPQPWLLLGAGNYAAVFTHPEYPRYAVKVYAPGKPGLEAECEVYRLLGDHPSYSTCHYAEDSFLVLKQLMGTTIYDCFQRGIFIPEQAVRDIEQAMHYARSVGLRPHDVHAKNIMLYQGRGLVVDVSDFLKQEPCRMWEDFKKAYDRVYYPIASRLLFPLPPFLLEGVRKGYQIYRRRRRKTKQLPPQVPQA